MSIFSTPTYTCTYIHVYKKQFEESKMKANQGGKTKPTKTKNQKAPQLFILPLTSKPLSPPSWITDWFWHEDTFS